LVGIGNRYWVGTAVGTVVCGVGQVSALVGVGAGNWVRTAVGTVVNDE
jgi:hypothetical protein